MRTGRHAASVSYWAMLAGLPALLFMAARVDGHSGPDERPAPHFANVLLPNGVRLHYAASGDAAGEAVIFLHGYTDSWFSFSSTRYAYDNVFTTTVESHVTGQPTNQVYALQHNALGAQTVETDPAGTSQRFFYDDR